MKDNNYTLTGKNCICETDQAESIRTAVSSDVPEIYRIMTDAKAGMEHPERYFTDSPEFIRDVIEKNGYSLIFEVDGEMAGFLNMIRKEDAETERFLRLAASVGTGETAGSSGCLELLRSVIPYDCMFADSCAVDSRFRGRRIQYKLYRKAEEIERKRGTRILLTTVHPENAPSVKSILRAGYELVITSDNLYENHAGQVRNLMVRVLN